jgi:Na+/H+-dicarboxylate symporter
MHNPQTEETNGPPEAEDPGWRSPRRMGLGVQILLGMVVGGLVGAILGERVQIVAPIGDAFIRLLMMAAIPLVFFNLLAGLTSLTDLRTFGRLASKILVYFGATTAVALAIGMAIIAALDPGAGVTLTETVNRSVGDVPTVTQIILDLIPLNIFAAFAEGNVAQIVVVSVLMGVATLLLPEDPRDRLRQAYSDLADLFRKLVDLILIVAPYGIGALMAVTVGLYGRDLFGPMTTFILGVTAAHAVVVVLYAILIRLFTAWRPWTFFRRTGAVWATTAATTSSLASLSVALEVAEEIELPRPVYSFVLPLGAQVNKDGTGIFLVAVALFTAQAAGLALAPAEYFTLFLMAFLLSAGSGGIPGGGFVVGLILVQAFSMPLELAAIVGGIYRLVDMGNTTVNVMGDMVGAVLVTESERGR